METQSIIEGTPKYLWLLKFLYDIVEDRAKQELEKRAILFRPETKALQKELFFSLFWDNISSDVGRVHPHYPYGLHPGNLVAAEEISKSLVSIFTRRKIRPFSQINETNQNSNLILIGGPVSTFTSRKIMGYDENKIEEESETDLRFVLNLNKKDLYDCKITINGEKVEEPNYEIIDRDSGKSYTPICDDEGCLQEDFLLVSVLPNNLTEKKKFAIIISGTHFVGTRAFALVLRHKETLEEIKKNKDELQTRSFQSLLHITDIKKEPDYYEPLKIEHLYTIPMETEFY